MSTRTDRSSRRPFLPRPLPRRAPRRPRRRQLSAEWLEHRHLLSASGWLHNAERPADVNADGGVSPLDAMLVLNHLNAQQSGAALAMPSPPEDAAPLYVDVSNDQALSPLDAVLVINKLNEQAEQNGEELIRVRLDVVHPDCTDFAPLFSEEPAAFTIGVTEVVLLRGFVQDLRNIPEGGVRAAFVDVNWDTTLLEPVGNIEFGETFPNGQSGQVIESGIDELGGVDSMTPTGGQEVMLFAIPLRTTASGTVPFTLDPAEDVAHHFELYDLVGVIDSSEVQFEGTEITIVNGLRPSTMNDAFSTSTGEALSVPAETGLLTNDSDPEDQPLTAILVDAPTNGDLTLNPNGAFTYTPHNGFVGTDSFTYVATDGDLITCPATVTLEVGPGNQPPTATADVYELVEDQTLTVEASQGVLINDTDPDEDALQAILVTDPVNGTVEFQADGSFTYTPNENFNGSDSFTYAVTDGEFQSDPVQVTLTVAAVNDTPEAAADSYTVAIDQVLDVPAITGVLANDSDVDDAVLVAQLVTEPANGELQLNEDGSFVYTPNLGFAGQDSFTYVASDGGLASQPQTVTITVSEAAVVDFILAPVTLTGDPLDAVTPGGEFLLRVFAHDIGNPPRDGVFSAYMDLLFDTSLLDVNGPIAYGSSYPNAQSGTVMEEQGLVDELGAVGTGVVLGEEPVLLATIPFVAVEAGTAEITTEPADQLPLHEIVLLNEAEAVPPAQVRFGAATITIIAGERPEAVPDEYTTPEDTVLTVSAEEGVLANDSDPDDDPLVAQLVAAPAHGSVDLQPDGSFVYTPADDFFGTDTFTYVASDGVTQSAAATVTIDVTPVDDPPVAVDDQYELVAVDEPLVVSAELGVLANDSDPDGGELTAELVTDPQFGSVTLNADGSFTYTPDEGFLGNDQFQYVAVSDGTSSEPATVRIDVGNINEPTTIHGRAYLDANNDGQWEEGELTLGGVEIALVGLDADGQEVSLETVTAADGSYAFPPVLRGDYVLGTSQPLHLVDGLDDVDGQLDKDGDVLSLSVPAGADMEIHFAERGLAPKHVGNNLFFSSHQPGGVVVGLNPGGEQEWFALDDGWRGFTSVTIGLDSQQLTAHVSVVQPNGQVVTADVPLLGNPQATVTGTPEGGYVVRLDGPASDFGLPSPQVPGSLAAAAVDAAFRDSV